MDAYQVSAYHAGIIVGVLVTLFFVGSAWALSKIAFVRRTVTLEWAAPILWTVVVITILHDWRWPTAFIDWRWWALTCGGGLIYVSLEGPVRKYAGSLRVSRE